MKQIKVYIAGKVNPNSVFGRHDWRDGFCDQLSVLSGYEIINIDPTKSSDDYELDEQNSELIFGRDCFMIKSADIVIVNLTDDISVGGSQEMLIAKYFAKPLIGIAPRGGKFNTDEKIIQGKVFIDYVNPFVVIPCDFVAEDINEASTFIKQIIKDTDSKIKDITVIEDSLKYYIDNHHDKDDYLKNL